MELTKEQLKQLLPKNLYIDHWHDALSSLLPDYEINTPQRMAAFIAQCSHESGGFIFLKENLNYKAPSLRKLFGKYFPTDDIANEYANKPNKQEAIANRIYASRMGNGNEASGDGYKFCGRGLIQLTGRDNYARVGRALGLDLVNRPELAENPEIAAKIAVHFWQNRVVPRVDNFADTAAVTRPINRRLTGLDDRDEKFKGLHHVLVANK